MKTILDLPDDLMRAVKIRAHNEDWRLKDVLTDVIRRGLAQEPQTSGRRVKLPLVECAHEATGDEEMTPDKVADILLRDEVRMVTDAS
jgi:hypothetical protein